MKALNLAHYNCGTDTGIHSGEPDATGWQIEPHIRHNNTISTPPEKADKKIHIPWECEWPTTSVGDNPLGFKITGVNNVTFDTTQSKSIKGSLFQVQCLFSHIITNLNGCIGTIFIRFCT